VVVLGLDVLGTLHRMRGCQRRHGSASDRRDTPPVDVFFGVTAGLLARRSSLLPVFPMRKRISDLQAGATHCLQLRGQRRNLADFTRSTGFPLSYQILRSGGPWRLYVV